MLANSYGGGIFNTGTLTTIHDTISGNSAQNGGGIYNDGISFRSLNSIVAGNTISTPVGGDLNVHGLIDIARNQVGGNVSSIFVTDGLGNPLLANNGGPTKTIALAPNSLAAGKGTFLTFVNSNQPPMTSTDSSVTVTDPTLITVGVSLRIDSEIVLVTGKAGSQITILRAQAGTTATSHFAGSRIYLVGQRQFRS